jgi:hypothetical protein
LGDEMSEQALRRGRTVAVLVVLSGATIIVACFLPWLSIASGVSVGTVSVGGTVDGISLIQGQVAIAAGAVAALLGIALLLVRGGRRLIGSLLLLSGGAAIGACALVLSAPLDGYIDYAVNTGAPAGQADEVTVSLENLFEASDTQADPRGGIYVAVVGGAMTIVVGLIAIRRRPGSARTGRGADRSQGSPLDETPSAPQGETAPLATHERSLGDAEPPVADEQEGAPEPSRDVDSEEEAASDGGEEHTPPPYKRALGDSWVG